MKKKNRSDVSTSKRKKQHPAGFYLRWNDIIDEFDTSVLDLEFISNRVPRSAVEDLLQALRDNPEYYAPAHSHWCDTLIPLFWVSMMLGITSTLMNFIFSLEFSGTAAVIRVIIILLAGFCSIIFAASTSFAHSKARSAARRSLFQPLIDRCNYEVLLKFGLKAWMPEYDNYLAFDFIDYRPMDIQSITNRFGPNLGLELAQSKACDQVFLLNTDELVYLDSEAKPEDY